MKGEIKIMATMIMQHFPLKEESTQVSQQEMEERKEKCRPASQPASQSNLPVVNAVLDHLTVHGLDATREA